MSKKILSVILALFVVLSCTTVAFAAATYSGNISGDVTIESNATIQDDAVFSGTVTIASGASVSKGTFNGAVINNSSGGFLSNGITGGVFNGSVTNSNGATISGGTFNGNVTNNGEIKGSILSYATFKGGVSNKSTISAGAFECNVSNEGTIKGGNYNNIISNSGTVDSSVSALIKNGNAYTVQKNPSIKGKVSISGSNASFTINSGSTLFIEEGAELSLNCKCAINGKISILSGGKLTSNGASNEGSNGTIMVPLGASFTGTTASKFDAITYREHNITFDSNVDIDQFTFTVSSSAYRAETVAYALDWAGTSSGCITVNNVTVYRGKKNDKNIITKSTSGTGTFTMPDEDVFIYIDCVANHIATKQHKDATCTLDGYDRSVCSVCNHEISYTKIPAKGHSWTEWTYNNSSASVLKSRSCTVCGEVENAYLEIKNEVAGRNLTVDYKSTLTFNANVKTDKTYTLVWLYTVNGETRRVNDNGSGSFTVNQATSDFKVCAMVIGAVNDTSEVQNITVKHGFFDKIIAFFRGLFKALPVYIDNVKQ